MKKKTVFFTHSQALAILFILGNAVIGLPVKNANEYTFLGYMVSAVAALGINLAFIPFANRIFCDNAAKNSGKLKKLGLFICYIAAALLALWCAGQAFYDFCEFISQILLPDTPKTIAFISFGFVVAFFGSRRQEDVLKLALLSFWLCLAAVLFFFFATAHNYNLRNIFIFRLPDFKVLLAQAKPYFLNPVVPSLLITVYQVLVFKKCRSGAVFYGVASGLCVLGLCILGPLLLFGAPLAGRLDYPYASAVSTVTVGRLFTRMDGFSYFVYFTAALIKINTCIFIIHSMLKKLNGLCKRHVIQ